MSAIVQSGSNQPIRFDLSEVARKVNNSTLRKVYLVGGIFLLLADIGATAKEASDITSPGFMGSAGQNILLFAIWQNLFIGGLGIFLLWSYLVLLAPSASELQIGPDWIRIHFPSGRICQQSWKDRKVHIRILDRSQDPNWYWQYKLMVFPYPPSVLTKGAYDALMATARNSGLKITQTFQPENPLLGRRKSGTMIDISNSVG